MTRSFKYNKAVKRPTRKALLSSRQFRASSFHGPNTSEAKFTDLMHSATQGALVFDLNFQPLYVNPYYASKVGCSIPEVMGLDNIKALFAPKYHDHLNAVIKLSFYKFSSFKSSKTKTSKPEDTFEQDIMHDCGNMVVLHYVLSSIKWRGVPAILASSFDVTEQSRNHKELLLEKERFNDFIVGNADSFWEMDKNFGLSYMIDPFNFSPQFRDQLHGMNVKEFFTMGPGSNQKTETERNDVAKHVDMILKGKPFRDFEYKVHDADGSFVVHRTSGKPILDDEGKFCGYRGVTRDVTNEVQLSEKLNYQATHDELTGLINRRHFDNEIHKAIDDAIVHHNSHVLVFIDLDRFKIVNDTCGHVAGDELLRQIASIFQNTFSQSDIISRMGGDEFAVIMRNISIEESVKVTQRLHDKFEHFRFTWEGNTFSIGVSAGMATIDRDSESVSVLLQNVDGACYFAKQNGRNKTHVFSENDEDFSQRKGDMAWVSRIVDALENDGFVLFGQPIMPLVDSECAGFFELLIRMKDGDKLIAPGFFLPAAERYDLSIKIDKWVLRRAFEWIASCPTVLINCKHVFINLSGNTIGNQDFQRYILSLLNEYDVEPNKICFEVTETAAIANLAQAVDFINELKELGCFFALDDFGSGLSSFGYLKNLPVDYLKIDGMFVRDMAENEVNLAMIKSINDISHVMGKKTIAEFVEDDRSLSMLSSLGVDYAQGYYISRPLPLDKLAKPNQAPQFVSERSKQYRLTHTNTQ